MEYLDVCDECGEPTGEIVERNAAHREGVLHRTAHVWLVRIKDGHTEVLLQKRSGQKDSFPGLYDTSSAGHIPAGSGVVESALRELNEELGITADREELHFAGTFHIGYDKVFHGKIFRDREIAFVYVYNASPGEAEMRLQQEEIEEVKWFRLSSLCASLQAERSKFCVPTAGMNVLLSWLKKYNYSEVGDIEFV